MIIIIIKIKVKNQIIILNYYRILIIKFKTYIILYIE